MSLSANPWAKKTPRRFIWIWHQSMGFDQNRVLVVFYCLFNAPLYGPLPRNTVAGHLVLYQTTKAWMMSHSRLLSKFMASSVTTGQFSVAPLLFTSISSDEWRNVEIKCPPFSASSPSALCSEAKSPFSGATKCSNCVVAAEMHAGKKNSCPSLFHHIYAWRNRSSRIFGCVSSLFFLLFALLRPNGDDWGVDWLGINWPPCPPPLQVYS